MAQKLRAFTVLFCFPPRGPGFDSQHAHGSLQPSVIFIPGESGALSGLHRHQALTWYINIQTDKTLIHNIFFN